MPAAAITPLTLETRFLPKLSPDCFPASSDSLFKSLDIEPLMPWAEGTIWTKALPKSVVIVCSFLN